VRLADDFPSLEELDAADGDGLPYLTPEERDQELPHRTGNRTARLCQVLH
jgi:hypothetical protein